MPRAIDFHIHPPNERGESLTSSSEAQRYFRSGPPPSSVEEMAEYYARLDIMGVIFDIDAETVTGRRYASNDHIAGIVQRYPSQFIGFGSVDPWKGKAAVNETRRCAQELGMRGMKFMPSMQRFFANEERFYPLWEVCQELGLVVLIHSGTTGVGAGAPGGGGIKLKYTQPIPYIDDVAADFPGLNIVMAHPAWPWQEEQLAMLVHKPNLYMDLSGWSPKYFQPSLIQYANNLISERVLFGSDYPVIMPERWLADFEQAPFKDEVRPMILLENAKRLLGLDLSGS